VSFVNLPVLTPVNNRIKKLANMRLRPPQDKFFQNKNVNMAVFYRIFRFFALFIQKTKKKAEI
jgi:hypothetical protein